MKQRITVPRKDGSTILLFNGERWMIDAGLFGLERFESWLYLNEITKDDLVAFLQKLGQWTETGFLAIEPSRVSQDALFAELATRA